MTRTENGGRLFVLFTAALIGWSSPVQAAGWVKKKSCPTCETCPCPTPVTPPLELRPAPEAQAAPDQAAPEVPPEAVPSTDLTQSLEDTLTGEYDVAAAPNVSAPNMIGDNFGSFSTVTIITGTVSLPGSVVTNSVSFASSQSPGTGGGVGRIKLADNTSILPVDRVFIAGEFFNNVPISPNGTDVNRFTPGIEKTFFGGSTSVEVRVPFAGTIDSTQDLNSLGTSDVELGNVTLFFKGLLLMTDTAAFGAGLTVTTPTANDTRIFNSNVEVLRIENEGCHVAPYLGFVWMPGRFFTQLYGQYDVDATGRPVYIPDAQGALQEIGRFTDTTFGFVDWSVGYWLYQSGQSDSFLSGIAPVAEVHYNAAMGNGDTVSGSFAPRSGASITDANDDMDLVNVTIGTHFTFGQRTALTIAGGFPTTSGDDRQFDYEFKVLLNHYFGRVNRFNLVPSSL